MKKLDFWKTDEVDVCSEINLEHNNNYANEILCFLLQHKKLKDKDIVEMIFFPVVNEACRVLAEGIAVKSSDLDIASVMGMGFPPYRWVTLTHAKTSFYEQQ